MLYSHKYIWYMHIDVDLDINMDIDTLFLLENLFPDSAMKKMMCHEKDACLCLRIYMVTLSYSLENCHQVC